MPHARRKRQPSPRKVTLTGQGDYDLQKASNKDLAKEAGGRLAGKVWETLFGSGAYAIHKKVKSNSLMAAITANGPPSIHSSGSTGTRFRHRDPLGIIVGSKNFKVQTFQINPGVRSTFPYLSNAAAGFMQYRIRGMVFEFLSTCGNVASTSPAVGVVIMCTNYDSSEVPFETRIEMEGSDFCSVCKPSQSMLHPIECKASESPMKVMLVRHETELDVNIQNYDFGLFQIATDGNLNDGDALGELWVSYDIELLKPVLSPRGGSVSHIFWDSDLGTAIYGQPFTGGNFAVNELGLKLAEGGTGIQFPFCLPGDTFLFHINVYFATNQNACTVSTAYTQMEAVKFERDSSGDLVTVDIQRSPYGSGSESLYENSWGLIRVTGTIVDPINPPEFYFHFTAPTWSSCTRLNMTIVQVHDLAPKAITRALKHAISMKPVEDPEGAPGSKTELSVRKKR